MSDTPNLSWWRTKSGIALFGFLAIAGYFLIAEHRAHFFGALPYLLLLACPLMHLFHGHGGHDGHDHAGHDKHAETPNGEKK